MFVSRLILDPRCRQVRAEMLSPYEMHRTLQRGFDADRVEAGMLYRVDVDRATGVPTVLVQSQVEPSWDFVDQLPRYVLLTGEPNPDYKPFSPVFLAGQLLHFRLRANPTRKLSNRRTDTKHGVRVGLYTEEEQLAWLARKGEEGGFSVVSCHVVPEGKVYGKKTDPEKLDKDGKPKKHDMQHLAVRFDGVLQVTDPEALLGTVRRGIGSAKAFGFGLLSLARIEVTDG